MHAVDESGERMGRWHWAFEIRPGKAALRTVPLRLTPTCAALEPHSSAVLAHSCRGMPQSGGTPALALLRLRRADCSSARCRPYQPAGLRWVREISAGMRA